MPKHKQPILGLIAAIAAYFTLWLALPKATFVPPALGLVLSTVVFMAVQIAMVYFLAGLKLSFWQSLVGLIACLICAIGVVFLAVALTGIPHKMGHYPPFRIMLELIGMYQGPLKPFYSLALILAPAFIGCLVSLAVRDKNMLLPVVMFAACIDYWTVTQGPVAVIMRNAPQVVAAVSAPIPRAGAGTFEPISMIGPGDFLFAALVFAVVHRVGLNGRRNYWWVFAMMTIGMLTVALGVLEFLPALTVLAVAVIAANRREFKLSREEKISTAIVAVILAASIAVAWIALRNQAEAAKKAPQKLRGPTSRSAPR